MFTAIKAWFLTSVIWVKIWPLAKEMIKVVIDGKITREEMTNAVDRLFKNRDEIKLW